MGRRPEEEIQAIIDALKDEIKKYRRKDVLTISANEIGRMYDIHPNTATKILRALGLDFDGVYWYFVHEDKK